MTREEFRAGLRRTAIVSIALVIAAGVVSAGFMMFGATARSGVSAGTGIVGLVLVFGGIATFGRTQPVRRGPTGFEVVERADRRDAEALTGGLLGLGIAFCAVALGIG